MSQSPVQFFLPSVPLGDELFGGPTEQTLPVPYLRQTASEWCWATSATMVSRFLLQNGIKICQVVSTLIVDQDCCNGAPSEDEAPADGGPTFIQSATPCNRTISAAQVDQLYSLLASSLYIVGRKLISKRFAIKFPLFGAPLKSLLPGAAAAGTSSWCGG